MNASQSALAFAANVRERMRELELSQEALAKLSGVSKSAIGYVINYRDAQSRHATLDTVDALGRALDRTPRDLITPRIAARSVHEETGRASEPARGVSPAGTPTGVDVGLLSMILEQVQALPKLSASQRAQLASEAYVTLAGSKKPPTRATVLRLVRAAS